MEATLYSSSFLCRGWCKQMNVRIYPLPCHRLLPLASSSCKMRQRNFSYQNKRQAKKINLERPTNPPSQVNGKEDSDPDNVVTSQVNGDEVTDPDNFVHQDSTLDSDEEIVSNGAIPSTREAEHSNEEIVENSSSPDETGSLFDGSAGSVEETILSNDEDLSTIAPDDDAPLSTRAAEGSQLSDIRLPDLIGMIRNAETNVHLLNQARVRALEDLERILTEKESLQGEINNLEMRLAEADARLKVAAQDKIHVELLEEQLEKLRKEFSIRSMREENIHNDSNNPAQDGYINSFSQDLDVLRKENMSLKDELQLLKEELSNVKETSNQVHILEKERSLLEYSLKELESKLAASQEEVSNISSLKSECKSLYDKVEHLQALLDNATKQADQAILVLQQNQELRKKVDRLEESLEDANAYKISSEKMKQYNELLQQKMKLLDERLQRSDEEIHSYVQLYQDSMKEFQDTLDNLKEESKKRTQDELEMPLEFWSLLLLMVEGWALEKKVSKAEAKFLRDMIWNREGTIREAYVSSKDKSEQEMISTFLRLASPPTEKLHVIHIAAEMAPVAKVGGLGDVVTGLSKALQKKGHLVEIVLPKYDCMQYEAIRDLKALDVPVESYFDGRLFRNKIWIGTVEGLPVYFIEPLHPGNFFWRGQLYGEKDDFKRFSYFSRAALELLLQAGKRPDIIHCHDWQTAFVAPLYWDMYVPKGLDSARICFTCHNFEYQGAAPASELGSCGLDVDHLNRPDRMQDNSAHDRVNPVKGAIVFSNIVTTVSPTYSQEVRTAEGGRGLHPTLNSHAKKFVGILNGIDTDAWNPSTDSFLKVQYSANDIEGKAENKEALRRYLGLSSASANQPLIGCITRLVPQKGVHLIRHAIYRTLELGGQFVLLGSSPVSHIQREFEDIRNHFENHEHVRLVLKYDEALSHSIYAAADMFIIPSIFEPCGLTQMIAMRYGSIPIARKTGGLNDSVFDMDDDTIPVQYRNGYTFLTADEQGFNNALERALNFYKTNSEGWRQLVQKVMNMDFSWDSSASLYEELYQKSVARARAANRA